jgi:hypothetical protein
MAPEHRPRPTRRSRSVPKGTVPPSLAILGYHQQLGSPSENAMATTKCAVYEPPITSLPYLVVVFLPDGTLQVQPQARRMRRRMPNRWRPKGREALTRHGPPSSHPIGSSGNRLSKAAFRECRPFSIVPLALVSPPSTRRAPKRDCSAALAGRYRQQSDRCHARVRSPFGDCLAALRQCRPCHETKTFPPAHLQKKRVTRISNS